MVIGDVSQTMMLVRRSKVLMGFDEYTCEDNK